MVFSTPYFNYKKALSIYLNDPHPIIPNEEFNSVCGIWFLRYDDIPKTLEELKNYTTLIVFKVLDKKKLQYARIKYGI
jgi:hypothetical protein